MRVEHLAIDGSVVTVEGEADLKAPITSAGWAIVPSLLRSHPFSVHPPGYSRIVERTVRSSVPGLNVEALEEFSVKSGRLRVAEVQLPTPTKATRQLTVGAWEGESGCLTSSFVGREKRRLVEVFDTLQFHESKAGVVIDSPVLPTPRPPEIIKEIPELGIVSIRPAIANELQRVPRARGFATQGGELFRFRPESRALLFVSRSAVAVITPVETAKRTERRDAEREADLKQAEALLRIAGTLQIEWKPRRALGIAV